MAIKETKGVPLRRKFFFCFLLINVYYIGNIDKTCPLLKNNF